MGADIHVYLAKKNGENVNFSDEFGRNSDWFTDMNGQGQDPEYDRLYMNYNINYGVSPYLDKEIASYKDEVGVYGFRFIKVSDFKKWFVDTRPDKKAGWVSRYVEWQIRTGKISIGEAIFNDLLRTYFDPEYPEQDQVFVEDVDESDLAKRIVNLLVAEGADPEDHLVWFFDC